MPGVPGRTRFERACWLVGVAGLAMLLLGVAGVLLALQVGFFWDTPNDVVPYWMNRALAAELLGANCVVAAACSLGAVQACKIVRGGRPGERAAERAAGEAAEA